LLSNIPSAIPHAPDRGWGSPQDANSFFFTPSRRKGILTYTEARDQLIRALRLSPPWFWVPRTVPPVSWTYSFRPDAPPKIDSVANLSRREQEVLDSLLENLSNKEIASKLNIAERTVKFHVQSP